MKHPRTTYLRPHCLQDELGIFHEEEQEGLVGLREDSGRSEAEQTARYSRSSNHNFQKHAVVTIRKLLRPNWRRGGPGAEGVAHQMWNIFLASGLKSKKLLVILFGEVDFADGACRSLLQRCGFEETLALEEHLVREAQRLLRERLVGTLEDAALPQLLANRNISKPAEFTAYFRELLAALRQGPLLKLRIDERTAQRIRASAP